MNEIVIHNRVEREETGDVSWKKNEKEIMFRSRGYFVLDWFLVCVYACVIGCTK